jgi:hypothetical protein
MSTKIYFNKVLVFADYVHLNFVYSYLIIYNAACISVTR